MNDQKVLQQDPDKETGSAFIVEGHEPLVRLPLLISLFPSLT